MDRVLLVFDDLQYSGHLEMTLRKVGFDTETITNEYNLSEKLLTFNPDYIIVKGNSPRVSCFQIGKKLKETVRYQGRVILIFPVDNKPQPDDLIKLRMDLLLFEPLSALRLVAHLLTLTSVDPSVIMDKLLRIAHTDAKFREHEQQILQSTGESIEAEIQHISGKIKQQTDGNEALDESAIQSFVDPNYKPPKTPSLKAVEAAPSSKAVEAAPYEGNLVPTSTGDEVYRMDPNYLQNLKAELEFLESELPLRVGSYNNSIKTVDQDLKKGLTKRITKSKANENLTITSAIEKKQRDQERIQFASALGKKKL